MLDLEVPTFKEKYDKNWFIEIKEKYKNTRAQILPIESWQPLINAWVQKYPNPNDWFVLHVKPNTNVDIYRVALRKKRFTWREVENKFYDTPTYLETPLSGLDVDEEVLLETVRDMKNKNGVLYYRNVPAPIVDKLYEDVFEERLVYPERFD